MTSGRLISKQGLLLQLSISLSIAVPSLTWADVVLDTSAAISEWSNNTELMYQGASSQCSASHTGAVNAEQ